MQKMRHNWLRPEVAAGMRTRVRASASKLACALHLQRTIVQLLTGRVAALITKFRLGVFLLAAAWMQAAIQPRLMERSMVVVEVLLVAVALLVVAQALSTRNGAGKLGAVDGTDDAGH